MKLRMNRITEGEEEVKIYYREMNEQIEAIVGLVEGFSQKISAQWENQRILIKPEEVLYLESVDSVTYIYLADKVAKVDKSLAEFTLRYENRGFFRCSKSMVLNIYKISYLKSESGNRIRATMENGEQVMISRKYAKMLRMVLKGGNGDEEDS